jgi:hypothetical protein
LHDAIRKAEANGIKLAVSSPCAELGFVLHFENQTAYVECSEAQSRAPVLIRCLKGHTDSALDTLGER